MIWYSSAYASNGPSSRTCSVPTFFDTDTPLVARFADESLGCEDGRARFLGVGVPPKELETAAIGDDDAAHADGPP